ncbi:MAG TPA: hypothetical protein VFU23_10720 [Gemmatimonadales bacterium]|nr:hypothetical protein [Gemmatimonadales bacterium]
MAREHQEGHMRNRMSVVLMAIAMAACHPRYVPLDERGVGGSGGLDSIRARILACIAVRDYDQAREYLKLAANMAEDEQARFEQMISAAERALVPFLEKALPHIFKADPGHFAEDTAEARELIQATVIEANFVGSRYGNAVYARTLETGIQIWAWVRDGTIREGGYNQVPRSINELLK